MLKCFFLYLPIYKILKTNGTFFHNKKFQKKIRRLKICFKNLGPGPDMGNELLLKSGPGLDFDIDIWISFHHFGSDSNKDF